MGYSRRRREKVFRTSLIKDSGPIRAGDDEVGTRDTKSKLSGFCYYKNKYCGLVLPAIWAYKTFTKSDCVRSLTLTLSGPVEARRITEQSCYKAGTHNFTFKINRTRQTNSFSSVKTAASWLFYQTNTGEGLYSTGELNEFSEEFRMRWSEECVQPRNQWKAEGTWVTADVVDQRSTLTGSINLSS